MQRVGYKTETQLSDKMESGNPTEQLIRNPYPPIEPYSTGFLKVSDVHTIYWEQSGNPDGHVSNHSLSQSFRMEWGFSIFGILVLLSVLFIFCSQLCFFMGDLEEEHHRVTEGSLILNFIGSFYLIR